MKVLLRELAGDLMLDLAVPGRLLARPGFRDEAQVQPDRMAQVFKERVRVAFHEFAGRRLTGVRFHLGVNCDRPVGLLHVEKLVSDALVQEKVLRNDRIGDVLGFDVYRYTGEDRDRHWLKLTTDEHPDIRKEFMTPAAEWRTPTPLVDGVLRGASRSPADYLEALHQAWNVATTSPGLSCSVPDVGFLVGLGHDDWLTRRFNLAILVTTDRANIDLDNVALYALDMATLAIRRHGIVTPLDRIVGRISVQTQPGSDALTVQLRLDRTKQSAIDQ